MFDALDRLYGSGGFLPRKADLFKPGLESLEDRAVPATFVVNDVGERRGVDWEFNSWGGELGGLYTSWEMDDAMATAVCDRERAGRYRAPFVLEGGSIHSDAEGTLLVTEECLLNANRNPTMSRAEIETAPARCQ